MATSPAAESSRARTRSDAVGFAGSASRPRRRPHQSGSRSAWRPKAPLWRRTRSGVAGGIPRSMGRDAAAGRHNGHGTAPKRQTTHRGRSNPRAVKRHPNLVSDCGDGPVGRVHRSRPRDPVRPQQAGAGQQCSDQQQQPADGRRGEDVKRVRTHRRPQRETGRRQPGQQVAGQGRPSSRRGAPVHLVSTIVHVIAHRADHPGERNPVSGGHLPGRPQPGRHRRNVTGQAALVGRKPRLRRIPGCGDRVNCASAAAAISRSLALQSVSVAAATAAGTVAPAASSRASSRSSPDSSTSNVGIDAARRHRVTDARWWPPPSRPPHRRRARRPGRSPARPAAPLLRSPPEPKPTMEEAPPHAGLPARAVPSIRTCPPTGAVLSIRTDHSSRTAPSIRAV